MEKKLEILLDIGNVKLSEDKKQQFLISWVSYLF